MDSETQLHQKLRDLPVAAPSADFEQRVLGAAWAGHAPARRWVLAGYAAAASVTLAVGLGLGGWLGDELNGGAAGGPPVALLEPGQVQSVRLMFTSPRAMTGVTVHLQLPAGVELAGFAGRSELRWQVDLQAGANALELPMIMQGLKGGVMTANFSHGQDRRQFTVLVRVRPEVAQSSQGAKEI